MKLAAARELLGLALQSRDSSVRSRGASLALTRSTPEDLLPLASRLLRDPFMPVRRAGLQAVCERNDPEGRDLLVRALADHAAGVRALASFHLQKAGFDVHSHYLRLLEHTKQRRTTTALIGLGETGSAHDFPTAEPFLKHRLSSVRKAALGCLFKLDRRRALPHLVGALGNAGDPAVSWKAARLLQAVPEMVAYDNLMTVFGSAGSTQIRANVFRILRRKSKWESLPPILAACADDDKRLRSLGHGALSKWLARYNVVFTEPRGDQLAAVSAALSGVSPHLLPEQRRELKLILEMWYQSAR